VRVVSFYSYKGGTGRTLLLANVAVLGARLGLRIVAVDLDIEAPGLSYKLLGSAPEGDGLTGWLRDLSRPAADHGVAWRLIPVDIDAPFADGGWLRLLPAGAPPSIGYLQLLRELHEDHALDEGPAVDALITLRDTIEKELQPDLLLIDARTGVTPTNSVINRVLSDDIVALTLATPEQLEGTRAVLRSLAPLTRPDSAEPLGLHVVLARVSGRPAEIGSYEWTEEERAAAGRVAEFLRAPTTPLAATLVVDRVQLLHEDATVRADETLLTRRSDAIGSTALHVDYQRIARQVLGPDIVDRAFESALGHASEDEALRVARFFARPDAILASRSEAAASPLARVSGTEDKPDLLDRIATLRQLAERDPTRRADLGSLLVETSVRQAELGERDNALTTITEAVGHYRQLAEADPARFLPDLARSLNNLAVRRAGTGDRDGGLATVTEAVGHYRQLAEADPARFLPDLAMSLNNLANRQAGTGDRDGALATITEAVGHYRQLAEADPARFLPDLAMSLNNLANRQGETGDRDGGLATITEAVSIRRQLAETDPARFLPDLASSLNNLANRQGETGDRDGGLATITEAVGHYRQLAEADPATFLPDLAGSLNNLAVRQGETGDRDGGLATITEAVSIRRQLAEASPAAFLPDLAISLNNLAIQQGETGDRDGGLATITEAVGHYRQLAEASPAAFLPDLARSLNNLAVQQGETGDRDGALATITEAVSIRRQLAEANPAAFLPDLAGSLNNLAIQQGGTGDRDGGLATITEAVGHYRQLAEASPAAFLPDLAISLHNLAVQQGETGDRDGALATITEAVDHYRELAKRYPARFAPELARALRNRAKLYKALKRRRQARSDLDEASALLRAALADERPADDPQ
jgi:tetratricopeptide (TPR) repeat protein